MAVYRNQDSPYGDFLPLTHSLWPLWRFVTQEVYWYWFIYRLFHNGSL